MSFDLQPLAMDEAAWQRVRAKFSADGVEVPDAATGQIERDGITAAFTWDGRTLRVTVLHKPLLYPERTVREKLTEYIETA